MEWIEASQLMVEGKKLTHNYFTPNEWVTMENGSYLFEDGVRCSAAEFWETRKENFWRSGWSLWEEPKKENTAPPENVNKLTNAELERLACLSEEMGEAIQVIGKIIRHGYESSNPTLPEAERKTNRESLAEELSHVSYWIEELGKTDDYEMITFMRHYDKKYHSAKKWLHYNETSIGYQK